MRKLSIKNILNKIFMSIKLEKRYPAHLKEKERLEVVKDYISHELSSLVKNNDKSLIDIEKIFCKCLNSSDDNIEENCKEIYDLFYGLSLIYKRKFIAREITAENCKWYKGKVKLKDLKFTGYIDGIPKERSEKIKEKTIEDIIKIEDIRKKIEENGKKYEEKRGNLVNDPIIVVREGDKYRILDGNGRALYKLYKSNFDLNTEIDAWIGECSSNERKNICIPFGIVHFFENNPDPES
ncbi:hypothetical protein YN1_7480 [Nanoarchaeota archaeon]